MTNPPPSLPVRGTTTTAPSGPLLVLAARIEGHDTFLTGSLTVNGHDVLVRITTLDAITTLQPTAPLPDGLPERWEGTLHLRHGLRPQSAPADLQDAARSVGCDLSALDPAELRYALTYLAEATTPEIRSARIDAIVGALPPVEGNTP